AMAVLAHPGAAVLGLEVLLIAVVYERVEALDCLDDHVAAFAAVAAIGSAELDEFLPPGGHAATPAVARADVDLRCIENLHGGNMRRRAKKYETRGGHAAARCESNKP